jgi:DNA adenine methylase
MRVIKSPALRYFGGKWRLAPWIIERLPPHRIYVEPFGGAASVLIRKPPSEVEVYNDLNHDVANLFQILRDETARADLMEVLRLTPYSREEYESALVGRPADPVERARRLVVRTHMSVDKHPTIRRKSGFDIRALPNVCRSYPATWTNYVDGLERVVERLRLVLIESVDAFEAIKRYDKEHTLFYCDPPYLHSTRGERPEAYGEYELSRAGHVRLAEVLRGLAGVAVVSGYRCGLYDELYAGWTRHDRTAQGNFGKRHKESLWVSPGAKPARLF